MAPDESKLDAAGFDDSKLNESTNDERESAAGAAAAESEQAKHEREFAALGDEKNPNFFLEFWWFLRENKRWWMAPILIALFLLMALAILSGTGAAPFIYSLF